MFSIIFLVCVMLHCLCWSLFAQVYVYSFGMTMKFAANYHSDSDVVSKDDFRWCFWLLNYCVLLKLQAIRRRNEIVSVNLLMSSETDMWTFGVLIYCFVLMIFKLDFYIKLQYKIIGWVLRVGYGASLNNITEANSSFFFVIRMCWSPST